MIDVQQELRDLAAAQQHIAQGRSRIRRQIDLIRELRRDGHDVEQALQLLAALRQSLDAQRMHKNVIVEVINDAV